MTATELKLRDTDTQLHLAVMHEGDEEVFRSCLNATIALGRSVTFVMQAESAHNPTLSQWYVQTIRNHPEQSLLRFFNEKRVHTIHRGVVTPKQKQVLNWSPVFASGNALQASPVFKHSWVLEGTEQYGLAAEEHALLLCKRYLTVLAELVAQWLRQRDAA
jgi:hypothetical protein